MATTNPAGEMPEIRFQREDKRKANEGITARYLAMYAPHSQTAIYFKRLVFV